MPIRILPPDLRAKIAAGEVVRRPASVAKELVENALDAGARSIHIETIEGGQRLIRVLDDGCGIPSAEVELVFARYSTSKLAQAADLERIHTLGFRGEALASIAAVSQVVLITCARDEEAGTLIRLEGGAVVHREGRGHPQGTAVTVENLFYNTPARRKFLRTVSTERRHISALVMCYAMAYPEVRFTLIHDRRQTFQSPGRGDMREVCIQAYGLEVARELLMLGLEEGEVRVSGLISPPAIHRASRDRLTFFVNRRWVQDWTLAHAVEEAYHTLLPSGRHPIAVVGLALDPALLDVNVHPAKSEVRFCDSSAVFRAVQRSVRATLVSGAPIPTARLSSQVGAHREEIGFGSGRQLPLNVERLEWLVRPVLKGSGREGDFAGTLPDSAGALSRTTKGAAEHRALPPLRVVGQVKRTYIIAEGPEGIYLIDQHAAHERVLYEQLRDQRKDSDVETQGLLSPQAIELTAEQKVTLEEYGDHLGKLGFELEPFGGQAVLIRTLPVLFQRDDPVQILARVLDDLAVKVDSLAVDLETHLMATVCKQAAIEAGQTLSLEEMRGLIYRLEQVEMPHTCPHGRPTTIQVSWKQLEREFGRG